MAEKFVIGVDLGGTTIKAGIVSSGGQILDQAHVPTCADKGPSAVIGQLTSVIRKLLEKSADKKISAIGIGAPGIFDEQRLMKAPPNFVGWDEVPLAKEIENIFHLPTASENDANVAALAESKFGAGVGIPNFLFVIWGTGVGGGIILNNKLYTGPTGGAGEIGHVSIKYDGPPCNCGSIGCVEAFVGQKYLSQRTADRLRQNPTSKLLELIGGDYNKIEPYYISQAARDGDRFAREILIESGTLLGIGLAAVMNIVDLRVSIIGGGISAAGSFVIKAIEDSVRAHVMKPLRPDIKVLEAKLGNLAGLLGAAGLVL